MYDVNITRMFFSTASQMSTIILSMRFCIPGSSLIASYLVVTFLA